MGLVLTTAAPQAMGSSFGTTCPATPCRRVSPAPLPACLPALPALAHLRCPAHPAFLSLPACLPRLPAGLRVGGGMRASAVVSDVSRVMDGMRDPGDATSFHFAYTLDAQAYLKPTGGWAKGWVVGGCWWQVASGWCRACAAQRRSGRMVSMRTAKSGQLPMMAPPLTAL